MSAPDDVDPVLDDYVAAFREVERPRAAAVRRNWRAIEARTTSRRGPWIAGTMAAAAVLLLFAWSPWRSSRAIQASDEAAREQTPYEHDDAPTGGAAEVRSAEPRAPAEPVHTGEAPSPVSEIIDAPIAPAETTPRAGSDASADPSASPVSRGKARRSAPAASAGAREDGPTALAEETALLRRIKGALGRGDASVALALTGEHTRRFPQGVFAHERSVAKARALCALGRLGEARQVADAFVQAHPRSHLVEQMRSICR